MFKGLKSSKAANRGVIEDQIPTEWGAITQGLKEGTIPTNLSATDAMIAKQALELFDELDYLVTGQMKGNIGINKANLLDQLFLDAINNVPTTTGVDLGIEQKILDLGKKFAEALKAKGGLNPLDPRILPKSKELIEYEEFVKDFNGMLRREIELRFSNWYKAHPNATREEQANAYKDILDNWYSKNKIPDTPLEIPKSTVPGETKKTKGFKPFKNILPNILGNVIKPKNKKFNGGAIPYFDGGNTSGPENQGIPAILHGGEYVIRKSSVNKYGTNMLQNINQGIYKRAGQYKIGGYVDGIGVPSIPRFSTPMTNYAKIAAPNVSTGTMQSESTHNYNFFVDNFIGESEWFNSMMKEYNMKVVPANQKQAGLESRVIKTYNGINRGM